MDDFEDNDNLLDEDNALDYILYEDMQKDSDQSKKTTSGCLGLILILVIPSGLFGIVTSYL